MPCVLSIGPDAYVRAYLDFMLLDRVGECVCSPTKWSPPPPD
jgi:hypothetical protein